MQYNVVQTSRKKTEKSSEKQFSFKKCVLLDLHPQNTNTGLMRTIKIESLKKITGNIRNNSTVPYQNTTANKDMCMAWLRDMRNFLWSDKVHEIHSFAYPKAMRRFYIK